MFRLFYLFQKYIVKTTLYLRSKTPVQLDFMLLWWTCVFIFADVFQYIMNFYETTVLYFFLVDMPENEAMKRLDEILIKTAI